MSAQGVWLVAVVCRFPHGHRIAVHVLFVEYLYANRHTHTQSIIYILDCMSKEHNGRTYGHIGLSTDKLPGLSIYVKYILKSKYSFYSV